MILNTREGYKIVYFKEERKPERIEYSIHGKWLFSIEGMNAGEITFKHIADGETISFLGEYVESKNTSKEIPQLLFTRPGLWIIEWEGKEYHLDVVCNDFSLFQLKKTAVVKVGEVRTLGMDEQIMATVNRLSREVENIKANLRDMKWRG